MNFRRQEDIEQGIWCWTKKIWILNFHRNWLFVFHFKTGKWFHIILLAWSNAFTTTQSIFYFYYIGCLLLAKSWLPKQFAATKIEYKINENAISVDEGKSQIQARFKEGYLEKPVRMKHLPKGNGMTSDITMSGFSKSFILITWRGYVIPLHLDKSQFWVL